MLLPVKKAKHLQHHRNALHPMDHRLSLMVVLIIEELPGRHSLRLAEMETYQWVGNTCYKFLL